MEVIPGLDVEFCAVEKDVQYEQVLRVRNLSGRSAKLRISRTPQFSYFEAKLTGTLSAIAPNLYADILVRFRFREDETMPRVLEDALEVKLETGASQRVRLVARRAESGSN